MIRTNSPGLNAGRSFLDGVLVQYAVPECPRSNLKTAERDSEPEKGPRRRETLASLLDTMDSKNWEARHVAYSTTLLHTYLAKHFVSAKENDRVLCKSNYCGRYPALSWALRANTFYFHLDSFPT